MLGSQHDSWVARTEYADLCLESPLSEHELSGAAVSFPESAMNDPQEPEPDTWGNLRGSLR